MRHLATLGLLSFVVAATNVIAQVPPQNAPPAATPPSPAPPVPPAPAGPDVPEVRKPVEALVSELKLDGAGFVVATADAELHRSHHGDIAGDTLLPAAGASKWLAVVTVMTLVDEGKIDLDVPVMRYVEEFSRDDKSRLTLRQCLANTSGLPPRLNDKVRGWDMKKFAHEAARSGVREQPGASFKAGEVGFQIAAIAAERVSGKSFHDLFAERVAVPLGMTQTKFGALQPLGAEPGVTELPWVAFGAVSTLDDYSRFLRMLVGKGVFAGHRVVSEASLTAMFRDQVLSNVEVHLQGFEAGRLRYGLGAWIEALPDNGMRVMEPGAFGISPWIDLDLGVGAVFLVRERVRAVLPNLASVQDAVRKIVRSPVVAGSDQTVTLRVGNADRRYLLHVPPAGERKQTWPLLVVLHGEAGDAEQMREATGLAEMGTRSGYVVVFPDGSGPSRKQLSWNCGSTPPANGETPADDVAFLRQVVADVQKKAAVDATRVYAVGFDHGGMMCHRLAREATDLFRGIAVIGGAMNFTTADAKEHLAVLLVHGTGDEQVRYGGGVPRAVNGRTVERTDASVQAALDYYLARNGLRGYPAQQRDGKVRIDTYSTSLNAGKGVDVGVVVPVRVISLDGGSHQWPGSLAPKQGEKPFPFDASRAVVAFFTELHDAQAAAAPR